MLAFSKSNLFSIINWNGLAWMGTLRNESMDRHKLIILTTNLLSFNGYIIARFCEFIIFFLSDGVADPVCGYGNEKK